MARYAESDRVCRASAGDGARAVRIADATSERRIGDRRAIWNRQQRVPYAALKKCSVSHIERQLEPVRRTIEILSDLLKFVVQFRGGPRQDPVRKARFKIAPERILIRPDQDRAYADDGTREEDFTRAAVSDREDDIVRSAGINLIHRSGRSRKSCRVDHVHF